MGSAASSLPENLTEQDVRNVSGESYNQVYYHALKNSDGFVSRDFLVTVSANGDEKEVFRLYLSFCPNGEIDSRTFAKLLKDSKSLSKNSFSSTDADLMFTRYKTQKKVINYSIFRHFMIPDIAAKKNLSTEQYIAKLAKCEGPVLHGTQAQANRFHDDKSTYTGSHAQGGPSFEASSGDSMN